MIAQYGRTQTAKDHSVEFKGLWMMKGQRRPGNGFDLSEAPSHLIRRCQQFYGDLYAREAGGKELTKQQFTLLCALEQNDGTSQTALVEITGIDRSTLAEMVRRMLEKGLLSRERTDTGGTGYKDMLKQMLSGLGED